MRVPAAIVINVSPHPFAPLLKERGWGEAVLLFVFISFSLIVTEGKITFPFASFSVTEEKIIFPFASFSVTEKKIIFPFASFSVTEGKIIFRFASFSVTEGKIIFPFASSTVCSSPFAVRFGSATYYLMKERGANIRHAVLTASPFLVNLKNIFYATFIYKFFRTYARMSFRPKGEISLWDVKIILGDSSSREARDSE